MDLKDAGERHTPTLAECFDQGLLLLFKILLLDELRELRYPGHVTPAEFVALALPAAVSCAERIELLLQRLALADKPEHFALGRLNHVLVVVDYFEPGLLNRVGIPVALSLKQNINLIDARDALIGLDLGGDLFGRGFEWIVFAHGVQRDSVFRSASARCAAVAETNRRLQPGVE